MMKKALIAALFAVVLMSFGSIAMADEAVQGPIIMTDTQMDNFVASGWGQNYRHETNLLDYVPANNGQASDPNLYVGDVISARPDGQNRTNHNYKGNAYFGILY